MIRAAVFAALLATPVLAQDVPVFDETLGFDIISFVDGEDGLLVRNGGNSFFCEVEEGPQDQYLVLSLCLPIIGPKAAGAVIRAQISNAQSEEALLDALNAMPDMAFMPSIEKTLRDLGCTISLAGDGEEAFVAALAPNIAAAAGYTAPLSPDAIDEIGEISEDAGETMMKQGRVTVDREARSVTLVGCE